MEGVPGRHTGGRSQTDVQQKQVREGRRSKGLGERGGGGMKEEGRKERVGGWVERNIAMNIAHSL